MSVTINRNAYDGRLRMALPNDQAAPLLPENVRAALVAYGTAQDRLTALTRLVRESEVRLREARRADVATRTDLVAAGKPDPGDLVTAKVQEEAALAKRSLPVLGELADRALQEVARTVAESAGTTLVELARDAVEQTRIIAAAVDTLEAAMVRRDRDRALIDWVRALQEGRQPGKIAAGGPDTVRMFDGLRTHFAGTGGVEYGHLPNGNGHDGRAERARAARVKAEGSQVEAEPAPVA